MTRGRSPWRGTLDRPPRCGTIYLASATDDEVGWSGSHCATTRTATTYTPLAHDDATRTTVATPAHPPTRAWARHCRRTRQPAGLSDTKSDGTDPALLNVAKTVPPDI